MKNGMKLSLMVLFAMFLMMFTTKNVVAEEISGDFEYKVTTNSSDEKCVYITDYIGTDENVVVPAILDNLPVIGIGYKSFSEKNQIITVTMQEGIQWISDFAFYGCENLQTIIIPGSINKISKNYGNYAFSQCSVLTNIQVALSSSDYSSVDGVLFNKNKTELIFYPEGKTQTKYAIPNTVQKIGDEAFYLSASTYLKELVFPASVKEIGNQAFGYSQLSTITDIYYSGSGNEWNEITDYSRKDWFQPLFETNVHYRDGMTSKQWAPISTVTLSCTQYKYDGKPKCPTVTVKDTKGNIVSSKYYTLTYKNNVNAGDAEAAECIVTFKENYSGYVTKYFTILPGKGNNIGNTTNDNTGTQMGSRPVNTVMTDKKSMCTVKVTSVSETAPTVSYIKSTNSLAKTITIPDTVKVDGITYKVTSVAASALANNKKVTKVTVCKNVTSIGKNAFYGDKNLKTITIKSSKLTSKSVGKNAFKGTNKKLTIKVPKKTVSSYKKFLGKKGNSKVKVKKG